MKTLFAIIGGIFTGAVIFVAGSRCYKDNEAYRELIDGSYGVATDVYEKIK